MYLYKRVIDNANDVKEGDHIYNVRRQIDEEYPSTFKLNVKTTTTLNDSSSAASSSPQTHHRGKLGVCQPLADITIPIDNEEIFARKKKKRRRSIDV